MQDNRIHPLFGDKKWGYSNKNGYALGKNKGEFTNGI